MTRNKRRCLCFYQPNDAEAIAAYCEKMARQGWLLEKIGFFMTFRAMEPEELNFTVAYFPAASVFDPQPTAEQYTYVDYCAAVGWELAAVKGPMQIFYTRRPETTPIETDEEEKFSAIRRSMGKTLVLPYGLVLVSLLLNLFSYVNRLNDAPLTFISSTASLLSLAVIAGAAVLILLILADHALWLLRSRRSLARGGGCARPWTGLHVAGLWLLLLLALVMLAALAGEARMDGRGNVLLLILLGTSAMYAIALAVLALLKKKAASRKTVRWGYAAAVILLVVLSTWGITRMALTMDWGREPAETYLTPWGAERDIFRDELPLTLEDLGYRVGEEDHCSYEATRRRSFLAEHSGYQQRAYGQENNLPGLFYSVTTIPWDGARQFCWERTAVPITDSLRGLTITLAECQPIDPQPWGAEAACYRDWGGDCYLLLYPNRVVIIRLEATITEEQLAILREFALKSATNNE